MVSKKEFVKCVLGCIKKVIRKINNRLKKYNNKKFKIIINKKLKMKIKLIYLETNYYKQLMNLVFYLKRENNNKLMILV